MPKLWKDDTHKCPFCVYSSKRGHMKTHLTKPKKNGKPRCDGLKKIIPEDLWKEKILPHYANDAKMPNLTFFSKNADSFLQIITKLTKLVGAIEM